MSMKFLTPTAATALFALFGTGCASVDSPASDETRTVAVRVVEGNPDRAEDAADADPDEVICSRRHAVGTHFPRMVCKTRAEREADRRDAAASINRSIEREARRRALEKQ